MSREERLARVVDLAYRTRRLFVSTDVTRAPGFGEVEAQLAASGVAVVVHPWLESGTLMAFNEVSHGQP